MKVLSNCLTLMDIQTTIESKMEGITVLGDLDLSHSDYKLLSSKAATLLKLESNASIIENYALCIAVYIVFGVQYEEQEAYLDKIAEYIDHLPQYRQKHFLNLFKDVILEYGLAEADDANDYSSMDDLRALTMKHANLSIIGESSEVDNKQAVNM